MADVPECLACGACCFSRLETFARVTGDDYARMGELAEGLVRFDGFRGYMRMADGHCAALVLDARAGRWLCGAYASRPQVCRDLARGSGACLAELDAKAERPLVALRQAR